jgi:hypothetical protein
MRQIKPWEAIGMSRASWYRHGKPTEKPERTSVAAAARAAGVSVRTHQRIMRVMAADMDLAVAMLKHGWCKPGQAEAIIKNPILLRKFRRMIKREPSEVEIRSSSAARSRKRSTDTKVSVGRRTGKDCKTRKLPRRSDL